MKKGVLFFAVVLRVSFRRGGGIIDMWLRGWF